MSNESRQGHLVCNLGRLVLDVAVENLVLFRQSTCKGPCLVVHGDSAGRSEWTGAYRGVLDVGCEQAARLCRRRLQLFVRDNAKV